MKLPYISEQEQRLRDCGFRRIVGVDEAGRGPLAGPVVAGAVIFPDDSTARAKWTDNLNDSKKLTESRREDLFEQITAHCQFGIGIVSAQIIDQINIRQASWQAMQDAVQNLIDKSGEIDYALIDGLPYSAAKWPYEAIVKGDAKVRSISAASIIAKVTRDRIMRDADTQFPQYGFAKHKGYGTRQHLQAITEYGACKIHRMSFKPLRRD